MKANSIQVLLFFLLIISNVQAQQKSVVYPLYSNKSSENLEITRIERNDTAVVLFMEVYNSPGNWNRISSGTTLKGVTTGKSYKLLSSKGFELDKQINMPPSGNVSFQLFFEPLDKSEQKISFIEGQAEGDYVVENVELNENYKKAPICCHISGTVVDRPQSSRLMLCEDLSQIRTSPWYSVPVHNGKFDYKIYANDKKKYHIIFWDEYIEGSMYSVPFIVENDKIEFTLYPRSDEATKRYKIKTTAPLNNEMRKFTAMEESRFQFNDIYSAEEVLYKAENYYTETYHAFWKKFEETKDRGERDKLYKERDQLEDSGAFYTDAAKALIKKSELRYDSLTAWRLQYMTKHPSLASLYLLKETAEMTKGRKKDITPCIDTYHKVFEKKFAKHPGGKSLQEFFDGLKIKVGSQYVDFTAPDLNENSVQLSDVVGDKVALIDLWASWCGPCRRGSISLIPVYEKYKDKGFTIVGVAREKDNTKNMIKAIQKDGYPWLNLVELNDKTQIWNKYGIPNAAGGTYLIDKSGRILAINPSAEEVEDILAKML